MSEYLHKMDKRKVVNALFKYFKMLAIQDGKAVSLLKQSDVVQTTSKLRFLPVLVWSSLHPLTLLALTLSGLLGQDRRVCSHPFGAVWAQIAVGTSDRS